MNSLRFMTNEIKGCKTNVLVKTYKAFNRPILEFGSAAYGTASNCQLNKLSVFMLVFWKTFMDSEIPG